MQIPPWITDQHGRFKRIAGKKIVQRRGVGKGYAAEKSDTSARVAESAALYVIAMQFTAKLECMLTGRIRNLVNKLVDGVWSLEFRPLECAQSGDESSRETNARQAARERPTDSGIQAVCRCRSVQISGERRLVEAVVAITGLVHPLRIRSPNPTSAKDLSTGVNL